MDFLASCVSPCLFSFVQVTFPYPQSLPRVTLLTYLPTCLQLVSLSSLHYRASFQVSSIWDGEDRFSPLSFLSFLVPVVFPSAFFTSLLIPVVLAFGTQDSPCLPCVPICVLIQPVFSYLLCGLGFRTFRCFGAINITESLICVPSVTALLQSPLFISFCPSLLLFFFLGASGHRILFMTLRGARWRRILLASHLFPYLSPCLFPTCLLISLSPLRFFSLGAFGQRNILVSRSSLLSPLLSVLRSGGFGDRTQVPSVFVLVSLLHSHMWLFSLGASGAQYAPCPLSVSVLVPLVLSNSCPYFSLSLSCCSSL